MPGEWLCTEKRKERVFVVNTQWTVGTPFSSTSATIPSGQCPPPRLCVALQNAGTSWQLLRWHPEYPKLGSIAQRECSWIVSQVDLLLYKRGRVTLLVPIPFLLLLLQKHQPKAAGTPLCWPLYNVGLHRLLTEK